MTDQGGWGNWPPQQRPDDQKSSDPTPDSAAPDAAAGRGEQSDPPRSYGAPSYGAPSYGAPSYGSPHQGGAPTEQQGYGRHGSRDEETDGQQPHQGAPYGQPSPPPTYQQPNQQQPTYQQPAQQQPQQQPGQSGQPYGGYGGGGSSSYSPPQDANQTQTYGAYNYQGGANQPGQPGQPGQYGQYGQYGAQPGQTATTKKRSGGKLALILGLVIVLVAGLGVGAWALFLRGGPAVTWQGKEVANPEELLTQAQSDLDTLVTDTKGVKGEDTRCYYAVPKSVAKDTPETDVSDTVYCGPALFVDGDTGKPFVPYGISAGSTDGDKVTLTISAKGAEGGATAVPGDQKLVRPDGASPPDGAGGLKVPEPPPAEENVFEAVSGVEVDDAPAGATMGSLTGGVTITKLGEIDRYGKGAEARSAPDGQKLIAFQLDDAAGDGSSDGATALGLTVSVDGGTGEKIPDLTGVNVIAVPTDAKTVDLVTSADSVKQTLSLLDGKPGKTNIAVLARDNRFGSFTVPKGFNFTETGGGSTANRPCTLTGSVAGLFYWADDEGSAKATAPGNAILETDLKYVFSTDSPPPFTGSSAGDSATFEPSHLTLTLPGGQKAQAKIVADRTVFEVPAGFTEGTITIGGAFTNSNAITFTVTAPVSFKVSIPKS